MIVDSQAATTEPREDARRSTEWCPECQTWRHDEPSWAREHNRVTGHRTHIRVTTIATWETQP